MTGMDTTHQKTITVRSDEDARRPEDENPALYDFYAATAFAGLSFLRVSPDEQKHQTPAEVANAQAKIVLWHDYIQMMIRSGGDRYETTGFKDGGGNGRPIKLLNYGPGRTFAMRVQFGTKDGGVDD
jgi:hypothetical protein